MFVVALIASFIALSESKKVTLEDSSDKAKERCEDNWSCCGKFIKTELLLQSTQGKCMENVLVM